MAQLIKRLWTRLRRRTDTGRIVILPVMAGLALLYSLVLAVALVEPFLDMQIDQPTLVTVIAQVMVAAVGPVALLGLWLRHPPSRRGIWVYDWIGGWMIAFAMGWLTVAGQELLGPDPSGHSPWLFAGGSVAWGVVGTALILIGSAYFTWAYQSERSERQRLESLMRFTRRVTNLEYQTILDETVRELYRLLQADACVLFLWNEERQVLLPAAGAHDQEHYPEEYVNRMMSFPCPKGFGLTGWVMETGEPYIAADVSREARAQSIPGYEETAKSCILAPVTVEGRRLGVVRLTRAGINQFTSEDLELCFSFAGQAALLIEHGRVLQELSDLSITDAMTGLYNSRHFHRVLEREVALARRHGQPLSLVMMDSDGLKDLNDRLGHQAGDAYLKGISQVIRESIRRTDYAFRYAGDEFILVLPLTDSDRATEAAERIREGVATLDVGDRQIAATISLGVATLPFHASDAEGLMAAADRAMYQSKRAGKNRTTLSKLPLTGTSSE